MSLPDHYTVGWICAISTEYVAAQAFLDEKYDGLEYVSPNDNNEYTLGKMGKHHVVIAVLPDGEYGISSAAGVATDMLRSFPNIRIGLMVRVGDGAPSPKHDIRLGDVVVSSPRDGNGGVFQYDFGRTIHDKGFRTTGFLNQPPMVLRAAVNGLKAQYECDGHGFENEIERIFKNKPRLRKKYERPDPNSDRLYKSGVVHPGTNDVSCAAVCGDNTTNLIFRHSRTEDEDNPAIHYGLIASANQVMKDASIRDRLILEKDVLCFEMEAAGLMNQFPCLVIRGICDYSDSHKSKEWQGYAAMVAAAYAKDLLCRILPSRIEAEETISQILDNVLQVVSKTDRNAEAIRSKWDKKEEIELLNWLGQVNHASQQRHLISRRQKGTGEWLLQSDEFQDWISQSKQTLFCPGIPGAGKTVMSSIVVEHLMARFEKDTTIGIAYIYCSYQPQQEQNYEGLFSSILRQLVQEQLNIPPDVSVLYEHHKIRGTHPSFDEIVRYAWDSEQQKLLLQGVFGIQQHTHLNLFATSRFVDEVTSQFEGCIFKEIRAQDDDILCYIIERIAWLPQDVTKDVFVQKNIKEAVVRAADGMFLLAELHMDFLRSQPTIGHIKRALRDLPQGLKGLDEAYEQAARRIEGQEEGYRELARRILVWITHAKRALSTAELRHALAISAGTKKLDEDFLPGIRMLGSVCAGLITVDKQSDIVRLVHYTTQEHFRRRNSFSNAETEITLACLAYLNFDTFGTGFCLTNEAFEKRLQLNPLYGYAAKNWGHHARAASAEVDDLILSFLENNNKMISSSQALTVSRDYSGYSQRVPKKVTGLHLAAFFGLDKPTIALLKKGHSKDDNDTFRQPPLSWAVRNGHETVVKLLLKNYSTDLEFKDAFGQTPLLWAAEKGHEAVVKLLLENGAKLETEDTFNQTPLLLAVSNGHEATVKLLLKAGANTEPAWNNYTSVHLAARIGHEAIMKLLLEAGARVESKSWKDPTPLYSAASSGHGAVVKLLLEAGTPLQSEYNSYTPLLSAVGNNHKEVVKLLLERGANQEHKSSSGETALRLAASNGHEALVRLLLKNGADLESKSNYGDTPLWSAAVNGHYAVIEILLDAGANSDVKTGNDMTLMQWAIENGHEAVINMLLERGADLESISINGLTPLSWAAAGNYRDIIMLLLKKGANLETTDALGTTPLSWAAEKGHRATVLLLLKKGAELESHDYFHGRTPLIWAADKGYEDLTRLLLQRGADIETEDAMGRTPLSWAAGQGCEPIVQLLLENSADLESKDIRFHRTPLSWAAGKGHEPVVRLLLESGAEIETKSSNGKTPLFWADGNGHGKIVELLLTKGARI